MLCSTINRLTRKEDTLLNTCYVTKKQTESDNLMSFLKPSVQERLLKAFLDVIILQLLKEKSATAYKIDNIILRKYQIKMSPSVTYAKLATMERQGLIECHLNNGKIYRITEKGKEITDNETAIIREIKVNAIIIFKFR